MTLLLLLACGWLLLAVAAGPARAEEGGTVVAPAADAAAHGKPSASQQPKADPPTADPGKADPPKAAPKAAPPGALPITKKPHSTTFLKNATRRAWCWKAGKSSPSAPDGSI